MKIRPFNFKLLILLWGIGGFSQESIVNIKDTETNKPIEYAYLFDQDGKLIDVTGKKGTLQISEKQVGKKLSIRRYGFVSQVLEYNHLSERPLVIYLKSSPIALNEVVVSNKEQDIESYWYYFQSYETKNDLVRRYIDGVVRYDIDRAKNDVEQHIIQYRSLANDSILKSEKSFFIQVSIEPTYIIEPEAKTLYEYVKSYPKSYSEIKTGSKDTIQFIRSGDLPEKATIYLDVDGREKKAYLSRMNKDEKTIKLLGAEYTPVFSVSETDYDYHNAYPYIQSQSNVNKKMFRSKKKRDFYERISYSKIVLIDARGIKKSEKTVKFKRENSYFLESFWLNKQILPYTKDIHFIDELQKMPNKYKK